MPYALLIMEPRERRKTRTDAEARDEYAQMLQYGESLAARGLFQGSNALKPDAHGVRLQTHAGQQVISDGPFSEAKEMIGGFFLIDCQTREQAIAIARECPAAAWATVEIREIGTCYDD